MFEILATEVLVTGGIAGISALALIVSLMMLRPPRRKEPAVDTDTAVRNAPYHRLHGVFSRTDA